MFRAQFKPVYFTALGKESISFTQYKFDYLIVIFCHMLIIGLSNIWISFPGESMVKNPPANSGEAGSIPGSGRPPGEGNGNPLQYSCLKNSMDRGVWWAIVHGCKRTGHNLKTKQQKQYLSHVLFLYIHSFIWQMFMVFLGLPGGSDDKESTCDARDPGLIPELGRSLWKENGNPLQYSCLENSMDRGAWQAMVHGVTKSWTWLSN